ncbi:polysaccharide deacetylase family protein [Flavobacterium suncheonense]|uniref:Polysaccharide deacetylase n=1 Tax=Flavobacterium suncheonense GH29-5 = DSM 17707 TaxID=1121899 RepID=A0A0A2MAL1_9FLAO|nr:polysaccharide deacetylase family protein [Flavobacterium suncheonense]KGO89677.1 polysaccharide deacetylase [Flavobacterium suncheonense GH29-5 = DSM 17707]
MLKHKNIIVSCLLTVLVLFLLKAVWWSYFLVFLFFSGMTAWGSFDIRLHYFLKAYTHNPNITQRKIALTFDDGPHEMTEKVLDLLQKANAKATFFCIGTQMEKHPELVRRILAEGHVLGNHTYSHSKTFGFFSTQKIKEEIERNDEILLNITGKKIKLFRPPFGVTNPNIAKALSVTGHQVIGWNIRSLDTVIAAEDMIFNRIQHKIQPGGIILLHDTSLKTVRVLERLLLFLQAEHYEMVTVDALLNVQAYEN